MTLQHVMYRLVVGIGFAAALTFTIVQPVSAACATKAQYTNAALSAAGRAQGTSRPKTRDNYMKSAYDSLAKAQSEKCLNPALSQEWAVADSWLGAFSALDRAAESQHTSERPCKSLHLAEAREGLALSWLELQKVHASLSQTASFQHAMRAVEHSANALSVRLPPLGADPAASHAFISSSVEAVANAPKANCAAIASH
jgi:hypothetical protein